MLRNALPPRTVVEAAMLEASSTTLEGAADIDAPSVAVALLPPRASRVKWGDGDRRVSCLAPSPDMPCEPGEQAQPLGRPTSVLAHSQCATATATAQLGCRQRFTTPCTAAAAATGPASHPHTTSLTSELLHVTTSVARPTHSYECFLTPRLALLPVPVTPSLIHLPAFCHCNRSRIAGHAVIQRSPHSSRLPLSSLTVSPLLAPTSAVV